MNFVILTETEFRKMGWFYDFEQSEKTIFNFNELEEMKYGSVTFEGYNEFVYAIAHTENKVVGILKLKINGEDSRRNKGFKNWVNFITVHPDFQNQGISKKLIELGFKWLSENGFDHILVSGYSSKGFFFAKDNFRSIAKKYNLKYKDEDCIGFPDKHADGTYIHETDYEKLLAA